jgi:DNA mismatch endonuclease, patch repair protein
MARIGSKDTKPELIVRKTLHAMGFRYRLHRMDLPGNPDIVLPKYRTVVFVHGCFWHGHCCRRGKRPSTRVEFWNSKIDGNICRDIQVRRQLQAREWRVFTIWECQTKDLDRLRGKLERIRGHAKER